jgi:hypothetical protein
MGFETASNISLKFSKEYEMLSALPQAGSVRIERNEKHPLDFD